MQKVIERAVCWLLILVTVAELSGNGIALGIQTSGRNAERVHNDQYQLVEATDQLGATVYYGNSIVLQFWMKTETAQGTNMTQKEI